jgi:hypothetical protein
MPSPASAARLNTFELIGRARVESPTPVGKEIFSAV